MIVVAIVLAGLAAALATRSPRPAGRLAHMLVGPEVREVAAPADIRPAGRREMSVLAIGAVLSAALFGAVATGMLVAGFATARGVRARRSHRRIRDAAAQSLPDVCRVLAAELRAGSLPADALEIAAGGAPEVVSTLLCAAAAAERLGASAAVAFERPPRGCEALRGLAVCWAVSQRTGAVLAESIQQLAVVFAAEIETRAVVDAELAGVRLSALVMAGLPAIGLALGAAIGSDPLHFLFGSGAGRLALAIAVTLDAGGLWWVSALGARAAL